MELTDRSGAQAYGSGLRREGGGQAQCEDSLEEARLHLRGGAGAEG